MLHVPIWLAIPIVLVTIAFVVATGVSAGLTAIERRFPGPTRLVVTILAISMCVYAIAGAVGFYGETNRVDPTYHGIENVPGATTFGVCALMVLGGSLLNWRGWRGAAWLVVVFGIVMIAKPLIIPLIDNGDDYALTHDGHYPTCRFDSGSHSRFWLPGLVSVVVGGILVARARRPPTSNPIAAAAVR